MPKRTGTAQLPKGTIASQGCLILQLSSLFFSPFPLILCKYFFSFAPNSEFCIKRVLQFILKYRLTVCSDCILRACVFVHCHVAPCRYSKQTFFRLSFVRIAEIRKHISINRHVAVFKQLCILFRLIQQQQVFESHIDDFLCLAMVLCLQIVLVAQCIQLFQKVLAHFFMALVKHIA